MRNADKLSQKGIATQPAQEIDCKILTDAVANFECVLVSEHETGDHVIFVGRVVCSHMNKDSDVKRLYTLERIRKGFKMGGVRLLGT